MMWTPLAPVPKLVEAFLVGFQAGAQISLAGEAHLPPPPKYLVLSARVTGSQVCLGPGQQGSLAVSHHGGEGAASESRDQQLQGAGRRCLRAALGFRMPLYSH